MAASNDVDQSRTTNAEHLNRQELAANVRKLNIQNGGQAMRTYRDLIFSELHKGREVQVVSDLLAYCKLDTWAMVRIWQEIWGKVL